MTDIDIINAGYKEYKMPTIKHASKFFQKRFDDNIGKKYFLDIYRYDFPDHPYTGEKIDTSYEFETQMRLNDKPINISLFGGYWEIEEAENFVEKLFKDFNFDYYEKW